MTKSKDERAAPESDSRPVYSKKLGENVEVDYNAQPVGDPRKENVGAAPTTWW